MGSQPSTPMLTDTTAAIAIPPPSKTRHCLCRPKAARTLTGQYLMGTNTPRHSPASVGRAFS